MPTQHIAFSVYCACGAAWYGTLSASIAEANRIRQAWSEHHSGPGHQLVDAKTAARARAREERRLVEEERHA